MIRGICCSVPQLPTIWAKLCTAGALRVHCRRTAGALRVHVSKTTQRRRREETSSMQMQQRNITI